MTSTLFIVQIVLAILITISVLLQKSSSIGLGAYSGSNESVFGAKGPAGFLTKATFILGLLFVINTLALGYLYSKENKKSAVDTIEKIAPAPKVAPFKTNAPAAPVAPDANKSANKASTTTAGNQNSKQDATNNKENNTTLEGTATASSQSSEQNTTRKKDNSSTTEGVSTTASSQSDKQAAPDSNTTTDSVATVQNNQGKKVNKESSTTTDSQGKKREATDSNTTTKSASKTSTSQSDKEATTDSNNTTNSVATAPNNQNTEVKDTTKKSDSNTSTESTTNSSSAADSEPKASGSTLEVEAEIKKLLSQKSIKFTTDSSFLESESIDTIKQIAEILKKYPNLKVEIGGHTDNIGNKQSNKKLSQERVDSVKKALVDFGVSSDSLRAVGYGSSKPLFDNNTEDNRAKNRRVEFKIVK